MALLPSDFLISLITAFLFVRLSPYLSISYYLLQGLFFFLPPEDDVLSKLQNTSSSRKSKGTNSNLSAEERLKRMYLTSTKIFHGCLDNTLYFEYYDLLIMFVTGSVTVFVISDAIRCFWGSGYQEISYLGLLSSLYLSLSLPAQIQWGHGLITYESKLATVVGFLSFVISLFAIYAPIGFFTFDLDKGFSIWVDQMKLVFKSLNVDPEDVYLHHLRDIFYVFLGLIASIFASTSFLSSLRFSRAYLDLIQSKEYSSLWNRLLAHLNMILPMLVCITFIKPLSEDLLLRSDLTKCSENDVSRDCTFETIDPSEWFMTESSWKAFRLYLLFFMVLIRMFSIRPFLQSFLLEPRESIANILRQTGPVDTSLIQDKIRIHFQYFPVVVVQYVAPVFTWLLLGLILKRKGQTNLFLCSSMKSTMLWIGFPENYLPICDLMKNPTSTQPFAVDLSDGIFTSQKVIQIMKGMISFTIATPGVFEPIISFFIWWTLCVWILLSFFGVAYWRNNPQAEISKDDKFVDKTTPKLPKNKQKEEKGKLKKKSM